MSRAQRQAGNRLTALVTLMNQYMAQGNSDVAVQAAHRILRRTSGTTSTPAIRSISGPTAEYRVRPSGGDTVPGSNRQPEKPQSPAAEAQIKNSPNSTRLYQRLRELYQATGRRDDA